MHTKQTIALIGAAGNRGAALARNLSRGNYRILLFAHGSDDIEAIMRTIRGQVPAADIEAIACSTDACWEADIIILATGMESYPEVAKQVCPVANQKVVITMDAAEVPGDNPAVVLHNLLPHAKVISLFASLSATDLDAAFAGSLQPEVLLLSKDAEALQTASELVQVAGCIPVKPALATDANRTISF